MADKKNPPDPRYDDQVKSGGKDGGKSTSGGADVDVVGNARVRDEDPSPDDVSVGKPRPRSDPDGCRLPL
jgi:hypothetical protein